MPGAGPSFRKVAADLHFPAGIDIEGELVFSHLPDAELVAALGDEISSAGVPFTGEDVHGDGQGVAVDLHVISPVHLHPLVGGCKVEAVAPGPRHPFGASHYRDLRVEGGIVLDDPLVFGKPRAYEIPDGSAEDLFMLVDDAPVVRQPASSVAGDGQVFVHEGRTQILGIQTVKHFMLQGEGIPRADYVLGGILLGIAPVHPETCMVVTLALLDHGGDVGALSALVAGAPSQHACVVPVAEHHPAGALAVHGFELRFRGH